MLLNEDIDVRCLRVRFSGTVSVRQFKSESRYDSHTLNRLYLYLNSSSTVLTLFKEVLTVFGMPASRETLVLEKGEHIFPFSFRMPGCQLPPSYKSVLDAPHGAVLYELYANLALPDRQAETARFELTVPSTLDGRDPEYLDAITLDGQLKVGRRISRDGAVSVQLSLPQQAYSSGTFNPLFNYSHLPEDTIPLSIKLNNHSSQDICLHSITLKQRLCVRIGDDFQSTFTEKRHVLEYSEHFPASCKLIQRDIMFRIPEATVIDPSFTTSVLRVEHVLQFKVSTVPRNTAKWQWKDKLRGVAQTKRFEIPVVVSGFPYMLWDFIGDRESVYTLPRYEREQQVERIPSEETLVSRELSVEEPKWPGDVESPISVQLR